MVTRISPALAAANWVSAHSAQFGDQMPIRSPWLEAQRQQPGGQRVGPAPSSSAKRPADALLHRDQRLGARPSGAAASSSACADRVSRSGGASAPLHVAQLGVHPAR